MSTTQPLDYYIKLTPELESFRFKGEVTIRLKADEAVDRVDLNLLELAVWQCRLEYNDQWRPLSFTVDPAREILSITLPESRKGELRIRIDYEGLINDKMAGFYRSRYTHQGQTRYIAVTQFQESAARQAFPCMDHPRYKAVFTLELLVPRGMTVIANTLAGQTQELDDHRQRVVFEPTPRMSTYLVFFGVGAFEQVRDDQDPRVRVIHLPGLAHTTELGLTFGRQALHYCEEYYGIPYPLPKMDLIAIPDFAFGAMENWGAITFRENLLLHFADLTSRAGVQRICEVIAHEIAHQWFGNLVTPEEWKYLWLNESFATYFGYGAVAHYNPQWEVWQQFLNNETATALSRDGLKETFAIEIPGGEHVVINSSTAPIIYNKGASIMRMIEGYIGGDAYRAGVHAYLEKHRYGCARSQDLWQAFETASSQPITAMMHSWIGQPGHPLIKVVRQGDTLTVRQERFTYLPTESGLTTWNHDDRSSRQALILDSTADELQLPPDCAFYKLNNHQTGFFRTQYTDENNMAALGRAIEEGTLGAEDRWGIQNDLFAMVRAHKIPLSAYLSFLDHYAEEKDYLPMISICGHLGQAFITVPEDQQGAVAEKGRILALGALKRINYLPPDEEPLTNALLRDQLLCQAALWNAEEAQSFARQQFQALTAGKPVHPDIAKSVMQIGALMEGEAALDWLVQRFDQSPSEHERLNILAALGFFRQWPLIEKALTFTLDRVPPRNRFLTITAAAVNPFALPHLWTWYLDHLTDLEAFHPLLYERVITSVWPYAGLGFPEDVYQFGEQYIKDHPQLADAAKLAMENLAINQQMRNGGLAG